MLIRKSALLILSVIILIFVAACGAKSSQTEFTQNLVVHAKSFEFDKRVYTVKKGEPVKITLESENVHGLQILDTKVKLIPGQSEIVTFDKAGEYHMFCSIPCGIGHRNMMATLKVE